MRELLVREAKRVTLSSIHKVEYQMERIHLAGALETFDAEVITNPAKGKVGTVAFIITRMVRFHGGQTSILRLGTQLEKQGYRVIYLVYKKQSVPEMKRCAEANLKGYKGKFASFDAYMRRCENEQRRIPDAVVATSWDTVSFAKKFRTSYKLYFVQDFEPYFYKFGEEFFMAKSTYEQGLHMISMGAWNKDMILRQCVPVSPIDVISFPYERTEYPEVPRDYDLYRRKRKFTMAVYVKFYGKRLPNLIPYMLENTAEKLAEYGIELEVLYFGEAKTFKTEFGKNLGQLTKEELHALYARADFGMVASMSNISLVPYEMHATGLPVIEFAEGTYPYFFPKDTALLAKIGDRDISALLFDAIDHPEKLRDMHIRAAEYMKDLSWERTANEFAAFLN